MNISIWRVIAVALPLAYAAAALAQTTNLRVNVSTTLTNIVVTWTNRGTLQAAPDPQGPWQDILEAPNPYRSPGTNGDEYFRAITRWSTRRNLLEANSEMGVAELNGKIYVIGGYPSSRVTVRT